MTRDQQCFTIPKVVADWYGMSQWHRSALLPVQLADTPTPQSATQGIQPVATAVSELLLISHPAEGRKLSWLQHTVG